MLYKILLHTPLGTMVAYADDTILYLLEFEDQQHLLRHQKKIELSKKILSIPTSEHPLLTLVQEQLEQYFSGTLREFTLKTSPQGTEFQCQVWHQLTLVPYGQTVTYKDISHQLNKEKSYRAVANAIGQNPLTLILPCHRVIGSHGNLTGYAGGLSRKKWLLNHEKMISDITN